MINENEIILAEGKVEVGGRIDDVCFYKELENNKCRFYHISSIVETLKKYEGKQIILKLEVKDE